MKRSPSRQSKTQAQAENTPVLVPVVEHVRHVCPKCGRPGLIVTGTRSTGLTHDHSMGEAGTLGVGGCGYYMVWKPLPPFVPVQVEPARYAFHEEGAYHE